MPRADLESLRARAAKLDLGEEALEINRQILDEDADDLAAANRIGRCLEHLGERLEALDHWQLIVELQPANTIAVKRLKALQHAMSKPQQQKRAVSDDWPRRPPSEIVEPQLAGPGRGACLRVLSRSIEMTEKIDASRLAVTDRPSDGRFRVSGGKGSGVTPWHGMLCVFVHGPAVTPEADAALRAAGGSVVFEAGGLKSLPESLEYGLPFDRVSEVEEILVQPHREHLIRSLQAGPAPWSRRHDPALRDYIVLQAMSAA